MRAGPELLEFGKARFLAELGVLINVYSAAMQPPQHQLPGRRAIMERHTGFPSFRCVAMTLPGDPGNAPPELRTQTGRDRLTVIGFAYGFHGASGQWWHDLVRSALAAAGGRDLAQAWLDDSFEVAEVHVHPGYQGRGVGRAMVPGADSSPAGADRPAVHAGHRQPGPPPVPGPGLHRPADRIPLPGNRSAVRPDGRGAAAAPAGPAGTG